MNAAIYARYSSHSQRDCSIEQQVAECTQYAAQHGLHVVQVYADRHLSGTTDKRPEFQHMLRDSGKGAWKVLICWKMDRFARSRYDSATYKYKLKKNGVAVQYAREAIPDGPEGIMLEAVLEGSAEYYSASLSQNVRRGMEYNATQCKINGGRVPFGYQRGPDGRYQVDEAEAAVVRSIFDDVGQGRPYTEIAAELNARHIRTKYGGEWGRGSFHRMIRNEIYIGVYHYHETRIPDGMPRIVTDEQFARANRSMDRRNNHPGQPTHHRDSANGGHYILTGKLRCGVCGRYMTGEYGKNPAGKVYRYYRCPHAKDDPCTMRRVSQEQIETTVADATLDVVLQPDMMQAITDAVMRYQDSVLAASPLESMRAELNDIQSALDNIMKAIEAGIFNGTTQTRMQELEARATELRRDIQVEEAMRPDLTRQDVEDWLLRFRSGDVRDAAFRQRLIDAFVSEVVLYEDDRVCIRFNFADGPDGPGGDGVRAGSAKVDHGCLIEHGDTTLYIFDAFALIVSPLVRHKQ